MHAYEAISFRYMMRLRIILYSRILPSQYLEYLILEMFRYKQEFIRRNQFKMTSNRHFELYTRVICICVYRLKLCNKTSVEKLMFNEQCFFLLRLQQRKSILHGASKRHINRHFNTTNDKVQFVNRIVFLPFL